jgi:lysine-N-methylase
MRSPLYQLPVEQNWDCHATGNCCREYRINISEDEARSIELQGWDTVRELGGLPPVRRRGWLRPRYFLNRRDDGGCVFLNPEGRCLIHERFGYDAKPLACRLFPYVLVPVANQWRVGLRFVCPSVARSAGRSISEHSAELAALAAGLAAREGLSTEGNEALTRPPRFDSNQQLDWPDLVAVGERFLELVRDRRDPMELRWRKCLALADLLHQTRLDRLPPVDRTRLLSLLLSTADHTQRDARLVAPPNAYGRLIFRLVASLYARKDHGPNRGIAAQGRLALIAAVARFARGAGPVPRMNLLLPESTFEQAEAPRGPLGDAAEKVLERYYTIKVGSFQFCGAHSFGLSFREGIESLATTLPVILWMMRIFRDMPPEASAIRAIGIVDDHFGYNPILASRRLRWALNLLARRGELARLIAWYGR